MSTPAPPPEQPPAEVERWLAAIVSRPPEPGDLVIDPPEAVAPDERGRP